MKSVRNWSIVILLTLSFGGLFSCDNDEVELIDAHYKKLEVSCGGDFEIPVLAGYWSIEYVEDATTGLKVTDKDGNPLALEVTGKVEAANEWLALSRSGEGAFVIHLKENFDKSSERIFLVCVNSAGKRDYVTIVQRAGSEYKLVKSEFEEIENQRDIYVSDKGCTPLTINNRGPESMWQPIGNMFQNVVESTFFNDDDYNNAFAWVPDEGVAVRLPDLMIDNKIWWAGAAWYKEYDTALYYKGYEVDGEMLYIPPYSTVRISGEITYCKRAGNYTFTIQNMDSGTRFEVKGRWKHIVPIDNRIVISDKGRK